MPIENKSACAEPRSRVAEYLGLAAGPQETAAEDTDLGARLVASEVLEQFFRAISDWVRPAWQGQGSVVRQEGQVRVSSGLLRGFSWQPAAAEYTVHSLDLPLAQVPIVQQQSRARAFSALLGSVSGQPAPSEYKKVYLLEPPTQLAISARTDAFFWSGQLCALVGSGDLPSGLWFTQCGLVLGTEAPSEILLRLAGHRIILPNPRDIAAYLAAHPQLARLLPNIGGEVRQAFGPEVELSLELYKDPEIDDRYLTLYVRKESYEPDILDRLQLVSGRFNHTLEEVSGYFLLATDFSRPRGSHAV
jgi:hypothetical protein